MKNFGEFMTGRLSYGKQQVSPWRDLGRLSIQILAQNERWPRGLGMQVVRQRPLTMPSGDGLEVVVRGAGERRKGE